MKQREKSQWFLALWLEQLVSWGVVYQDREEKEARVLWGGMMNSGLDPLDLRYFRDGPKLSQHGGELGFEPGLSVSRAMFCLAHHPRKSVQCTVELLRAKEESEKAYVQGRTSSWEYWW